MKLFRIRGGVHPADHKAMAAHRAIETLPLPELLHIPVQQHIGAAAKPLVRRGQMVRKGDLLASSQGNISAPVHAPTSGRIMGIGGYPANHPSGLSVRTITLKPDGLDEWTDLGEPVADPFALDSDEITRRVAAAGIVGMGGATFPSSVKLNLHKRYKLHTLAINGAECEPYLTCDDRLMQERAAQVIDGIRLMAHALHVNRILIGIENNKPDAQRCMREAATPFPGIEIVGLPMRYPMGSEKHLVQTLVGLETPARGLTADIGVVVHNPATAYAVHQALRENRPLVTRLVTVSGGAVRRTANLEVPIGTPVARLLEYVGGLTAEPARLIGGGPMMGQPLASTKVPIVKGSNGVLALTATEVGHAAEMPCIRCASCVRACPCGLLPLEMAAHARAGDLDGTLHLGLMDCVACGSCSYVCPANIPLVQYFNYAKGELAARQQAKHKQMETKRLAEQRAARMAEQQQRKREQMAQRKAEMAAKKAAEAAAREAQA